MGGQLSLRIVRGTAIDPKRSDTNTGQLTEKLPITAMFSGAWPQWFDEPYNVTGVRCNA